MAWREAVMMTRPREAQAMNSGGELVNCTRCWRPQPIDSFSTCQLRGGGRCNMCSARTRIAHYLLHAREVTLSDHFFKFLIAVPCLLLHACL